MSDSSDSDDHDNSKNDSDSDSGSGDNSDDNSDSDDEITNDKRSQDGSKITNVKSTDSSSSDSNDDDDADNDSDDDSDDTTSSKSSHEGSVSVSTENPFSIGVDFDQVQQRRERAKLAKKNRISLIGGGGGDSGDDDDNNEIEVVDESKMNEDEILHFLKMKMNVAHTKSIQRTSNLVDHQQRNNNNNNNRNEKKTDDKNTQNEFIKSYDKNLKPNIVIAHPKNGMDRTKLSKINDEYNHTHSARQKARSSFFNSLGMNLTTSSATDQLQENDMIYEEALIDMKPISVGKRSIAIWPYDDYHVVQQQFYQKVRELGDDETKEHFIVNRLCNIYSNNNNKSKSNKNIKKQKKKNNNKENTQQQQQQQQQQPNVVMNEHERLVQYQLQQQQFNSIPIFDRPPDPPDISSQVYGLTLTAFEETAVTRSISIVSTWLFDVGLIDELLTTGGVPTTRHNKNSTFVSESNNKRTKNRKTKGNNDDDDDDDDRSSKSLMNDDHEVEDMPVEEEITKMDREIMKLRNSTKRALSLVNSRLNDGVLAIGSEVQELVNAVITTKDDIGKLRDLSSYVYNGGNDGEQSSQFMLTKYPKLKQAINARRNLARVFRELDFFSQIPITCDRLREELHEGEWTANEWSSLRSVAREHVDLEIFLVEAESGMKKRMEEDEAEMQLQIALREKSKKNSTDPRGMKGRHQRGYNNSILNSTNYALIDRFLEEHVQNVWDMGEEISIRIMNGIGTAFELAMTNPAGMVALVEAVEVYESANTDYKAVHGEEAGKRNSKLQFTDMRAAALAELYKDFESRCLEVFNELLTQATEQPATVAGGNGVDGTVSTKEDEEEASNKIFSAILRAANELGSEIMIVHERMAPCFPESWAVTTLWTSCVAHVCSKNILQQIGGPDGQNLPDLSMKQLLDLVAWVENFRQSIDDIFPNLSKITASKRNYLDKPPRLLAENSKTIDIALAEDSLVWVNNTLWNIHNIAKEEFLFKTKETAELWLERGYSAEREVSQAMDGKYRTAFCEDVYAMTSIHLRTIRERLTRQSEALVQAVGVMFKILFDKQTKCRDSFCSDFQSCCAAANDFLRMSDKCEEMIEEIKSECNLTSKAAEALEEQSAALLGLYSSDAVFASKKTQVYCMQVIEEEVFEDLFSTEWLEDLEDNEIAHSIVRLLDECLEDLETFLDELMISKVAEAQINAAVNVYIKCLLQKAASNGNSKKSMFNDNADAIDRIKGDVAVIRSYFNEVAESFPTISKLIDDELESLNIVIELLSIAAGTSKADVKDSIIALHKLVKNTMITKLVVGDLWHIINPTEERKIYDTIEAMEDSLNVASDEKNTATQTPDRNFVPELRLDQMLAKHIEADTRSRPMKAEAMKKVEGVLLGWGLLRKKPTEEVPPTDSAEPGAVEVETDD